MQLLMNSERVCTGRLFICCNTMCRHCFQTVRPEQALLSSQRGLQKGHHSKTVLVQQLANSLVNNIPQSLYQSALTASPLRDCMVSVV